MGKRDGFFGLFLIVLLISLSGIISAEGGVHDGDSVKVGVDGIGKSLNELTNDEFSGLYSYSSAVKPNPGHNASEIWVIVGDKENTLLNALQSGEYGLCPGETSVSDSTNFPDVYHLASEIDVNGQSLQNMINNGDFCPEVISHDSYACYNDDVYWYDSEGTREEKKEECGSDYCETYGQCSTSPIAVCGRYYGYWVYRRCYDKGCSSGSCYSTSSVTHLSTECCTGSLGPASCSEAQGGCVGGGKVICTELYTLGLMDEETYQMDLEFAGEYFSKDALEGYHAWGIPAVKAMRQSEEDKELVIIFTEHFLNEVAYRMGESNTSDEIGKIFLDEAVPLFERIGVLINDPDWRSLFNSENSIIKGLISPISPLEKIMKDSQKTEYDELVEDYFTIEKVREMAYEARNRTSSDLEFVHALMENLEEAVEEIEEMAERI